MNKKLNYVFREVVDNYKDSYIGNSAFYIGFGLLCLFLGVSIVGGIYLFDIHILNTLTELDNIHYVYAYLLLLSLPCVATLKKGHRSNLKFWQTLAQNMGVFLLLGGLIVVGCFVLFAYQNTLGSYTFFMSVGGFVEIVGNFSVALILLFVIRQLMDKNIPFFELMVEAFFLAIILFALIQEFQSFFVYGLMESFRFIFGSDFGEIVLTPILFILVNLVLSPMLVLITTSLIEYKAIENTPQNPPLNSDFIKKEGE